MEYTVSYNYDSNSHILIRTFKGDVNINDIIESWNHVIKANLITKRCKGVISDLSEANLILHTEDKNKIFKYYNENIEVFGNFKMAQIIDSPEIVHPMIFNKEYPEFKCRACSTFETAKEWIEFN